MKRTSFNHQLTEAVTPLSPRQPDPRNGEVYACESIQTAYVDGQELETPDGFMWVYMSCSGNSGSAEHGFDTLQEADAAARERAARLGAVYAPPKSGARP